MKTVETLSIFVCILFFTLSWGDGAPQWRPQGRFGKRFISARHSDIMTALQSVADDSEQLEPLFMEDTGMNLDDDVIEDIYNNLESSKSIPSSPPSKQRFSGARICIESYIPGVFRCHRRKRSTDSMMTINEE